MVKPQPFYDPDQASPAYHLRYTWCGWPSVPPLPALSDSGWEALEAAWEDDGLRILERVCTPEKIVVTFSARPTLSPVRIAARAKGRLVHAYRTCDGLPVKLSRKVALRSIGSNTTADVQRYIERQVKAAGFVDPSFRDFLRQFTVVNNDVDLSAASLTLSGRYWYNLHLVLAVQGRCRFTDETVLATIRDRSFAIAAKKGYSIARLSAMPDHLHIALRGNVEQSPQEIALAFQNNLAYALNRGRVWQDGYYVGTFGEYNMNAVRRASRGESFSPAAQGGRGRRPTGSDAVLAGESSSPAGQAGRGRKQLPPGGTA